MIPEDIKWLQVENTTKCNAWCPACARNIDGYELLPTLVVEDLDTARFEEVLKSLPNLEVIQFCGTYGDFAAAKNVLEHVELAKKHSKKIQIHTHGGIRNEQWWAKLAVLLSDIEHDVWFAIDGLKGVHEIYRQGTDFDKTIANATAFINSGGSATWQFIPWAHNEHQIIDCMKLSQKLGFKKFKFVKSVRPSFEGRHWQTGQPIEFKPWKQDKKFNHFSNSQDEVKAENCLHLTQPSIYLNANGKISACCWFNLSRTSDTFSELPNIKLEIATIPNKTCIASCGTQKIK